MILNAASYEGQKVAFEGVVFKDHSETVYIEEYDEEQLPEYKDKLGREIGYVLSKDYWGLGIMPEALQESPRILQTPISTWI